MDETIISWTVPNWITVVLMVALGFMVIGLAGKIIGKMQGQGDA
jgi:hypothetical protein